LRGDGVRRCAVNRSGRARHEPAWPSQRSRGDVMNAIRLGLIQESTDRFAFALHADAPRTRLFREFGARDLRAGLVEQPDGGASIELGTLPEEVAHIREAFFEAMARDPESVVTGGVMALDTASDSWNLTVARDSAPAYHVALAFSFFPLRASLGEGRLLHVGYEVASARDVGAAWRLLHPSIAVQAAAILFPDAPTGADACALLAGREGVSDFLMGMGDTFSLADIECLARSNQVTSSVVLAAARGGQGEDRSWLYRVKLSERAVAQEGLLAVSYARARVRHGAGLRSRPPRADLRAEQRAFREAQIERFAHHLALLELCVEYGIGLWSCPASADSGAWLDSDSDEPSDQWSVAVSPE
jgi:hypothetical protein